MQQLREHRAGPGRITRWTRLALTLGGLSLVVAACGSGQPETGVTNEAGPPTGAAAPTQPPTAAARVAAPSPAASAAAPASPGPAASPRAAAQVGGQPLIVDDAATANPSLVAAQLRLPPGFGQQALTLALPPGFSIELLAAGLRAPRFMTLDEAGNLLVADARAGSIYRYPAESGTVRPQASPPRPLLSGLDGPSSLALQGGYLYVGETSRVARFRYAAAGDPGPAEVIVPDLPTGGHNTRTVVFGPDGKLYLGVGSSCNICQESDERRAAISRYNPDGSGYELFARGLRNAVGLAFQPGGGSLWATVNERDNQGNEIPPDLVTAVQQGGDYGWPRCQPPNGRPQQPGADCGGVTPPTVGIQAHSAPLGLAFYTGDRFPEPYRSSLYVAQHGSWNRQPPAAPKLLRIELQGGRPVAAYDFATGWQAQDNGRAGRPAGLLVAADGSLIVSDDQAGLLYRISAGA